LLPKVVEDERGKVKHGAGNVVTCKLSRRTSEEGRDWKQGAEGQRRCSKKGGKSTQGGGEQETRSHKKGGGKEKDERDWEAERRRGQTKSTGV
jgi:hypothetical protein